MNAKIKEKLVSCTFIIAAGLMVVGIIWGIELMRHRAFTKSFEVNYPRTEADRFAIRPLVVEKLKVMHDVLIEYHQKLDSARREVEEMDGGYTPEQIARRKKAFESYEDVARVIQKIDRNYNNAADHARLAGFGKEADENGFSPRMYGGPW
jgi:hypothetical protein